MNNEILKPTTDRFANRCGYSDVYPYEIVRIVSDKTIEVRAMDVSENKTKMDFDIGGFSAHCSNQSEQSYDYSSNEEAHVFRIRLGKQGWKCKNGNRFSIDAEPFKYHDYNF